MSKAKTFKAGDQVFAAMVKNNPPWPAQVVGKSGKKFKVELYGSHEIVIVKPEDIFYYLSNKQTYNKEAETRKDFLEAVNEIEEALQKRGGTDGEIQEETPSKKRKRNSDVNSGSAKKALKNVPSETIVKEVDPISTPESNNPNQTDDDVPFLPNLRILTELNLKNWIIYADAVKENPELYKYRRVESRLHFENQVFPALLPTGKYIGIKVHKSWPLTFDNEYDCAMYENDTASRVLLLKESIASGVVTLESDPDIFIPGFTITEIELRRDAEMKHVNSKYKRVERLRNESSLVETDSKIKSCLGITKADTNKALELLEDMFKISVDEIMLKKHPHIVELVRRLRKYSGNVAEWNLTPEELQNFNNDVQKIKTKADDLYKKFKGAVQLRVGSATFWEGFNDIVRKFREDCSHLNNREVFVLCAEPYSRVAIIDRLEQEEELQEADISLLNPEAVKEGEP